MHIKIEALWTTPLNMLLHDSQLHNKKVGDPDPATTHCAVQQTVVVSLVSSHSVVFLLLSI